MVKSHFKDTIYTNVVFSALVFSSLVHIIVDVFGIPIQKVK